MRIEYSKTAVKAINSFKFMKRLVLAWDPDFTKLTPAEKKRLDIAMAEIERGDTVRHEDINWDE